jgi:hypothetical protein
MWVGRELLDDDDGWMDYSIVLARPAHDMQNPFLRLLFHKQKTKRNARWQRISISSLASKKMYAVVDTWPESPS